MRRSATSLVACIVAGLALLPQRTTAHFVLTSPASWRVQDALGDPQKLGPCGDEGSAATTGVVTAFSPGETITITLDEVIFHPGHYRVALAVNDRGELPAEPPVTPGETACGSVPIMSPAVFPVLVDGALQHTVPFAGPQSIQVTLPSGVTCAHCTLQVLEFMSSHGAPCFYHHCADISIGGGTTTCDGDDDCGDDDVCTTDHCNPETNACEHVDTVTPTCDDDNACTLDTCNPADGCVTQPLTLADVTPGFLGVLEPPPCAGEQPPAAIGALFGKAETLLALAAETPAKAERLLRRASKRLRRAAKKSAKAEGRSISTECATALGAVLGEAHVRVQCLRGVPSDP